MNLNRDFLKTLGGILIIGLIVAATFLYGNSQRQNQINKQEQTATQTAKKGGKASPSKVAQSNAKSSSSTSQPAVSKPQANSLQGSGVGGGTLPSTTPRTGANDWAFMVAAALGVGYLTRNRRRQGYSF